MSDFLSDENWGWSEVGDVDETVWDQLRSYIPSAGATAPGKTTETPHSTPSFLESGKDSFHSETRNRNSVPQTCL